MKVAFVGKGGSGKTTLSALFCRYLASSHSPVIAIDADINQHLGDALGVSEEELTLLPPLGLEIDRIKEYLRGTNRKNALSWMNDSVGEDGANQIDPDFSLAAYVQEHQQQSDLLLHS